MKRLLPDRLRMALKPDAAARYELPTDVVSAARNRIRLAALLGTAGYALFFAVELSGFMGGSPLERRIDLIQDGISVALCGTLVLVAALSTLGDRWVLGMALVVEILLSALMSIADPWSAFDRTGHVPGLTWVIPVIILVPLLVPARPKTTLVVASLCAATMPAGLAALTAIGLVRAEPADYLAQVLAGLVAVGIASIAARVVYGAGRQITAARTIGSYQLEAPIGRGGAGEVWRARHLLLARPAAVKLLLPEHLQGPHEARERALTRFTREAEVTADLSSPHTIRLHDFGVSDDRSLYYVMELLVGSNLQHFVYQHGPLEPRRAVHFLQQACHSLGEAHARGLIHRDVKPSNLFVCCCGRDRDFVKVLDFGLSKPTVALPGAALTREGALLGTPGYMAPEQIFGQPVGPATDLYALGCVAYWLLAGTPPFDHDHPGTIMRMHAEAEPPPIAERAGQPIPPRLAALVMSCLAKDPGARPQDADRLRADLIASLEGPEWSQAEARAWWEQHPEGDRPTAQSTAAGPATVTATVTAVRPAPLSASAPASRTDSR